MFTLPANWDGEGAHEIDIATINRALTTIERILGFNSAAPSIVPLPSSGLQIEWHRNNRDLEIEFAPDGQIEWYFFNELTGEEEQGSVGTEITQLRGYLSQVS